MSSKFNANRRAFMGVSLPALAYCTLPAGGIAKDMPFEITKASKPSAGAAASANAVGNPDFETKRSVASFRTIVNTVIDNNDEPPFVSRFSDPAFLRNNGYNGMLARVFLPATVNYENFDTSLMRPGSLLRRKSDGYAEYCRAIFRAVKAEGLFVCPSTDLLVVPRVLQAKYGSELAPVGYQSHEGVLGGEKLVTSILTPRTQEVLRAQIAGLFDQFPEIDGITTRYGETYLHEWPEYAGSSPAKSPAEHAALVSILREEICVKRGKKLFYRTWDWRSYDPDNLHSSPIAYGKLSDAVEPHPDLIFSIKHSYGDFIRNTPFNPTLGTGRHRQVVEVSTNQAGNYGKSAHPYYIGQGIIDGWEEHSKDTASKPRCLRDLVGLPQMDGVYTWTRGDGWRGAYIANEMWVDLNALVLARFAREPGRSEEDLFIEVVRERFGIDGRDVELMRELALLSSLAVIRGQSSLVATVDQWWVRDDCISAIDLSSVVKDKKVKAVLAEKRESQVMWQRIEKLANSIQLKDASDQSFLSVSAAYGRIKYALFEQIWIMQLLAAQAKLRNKPIDQRRMRLAISAYDGLWGEWQSLRRSHLDCPTLHNDEDATYIGYPWTSGDTNARGIAFRTVLEQYRIECKGPPRPSLQAPV
jgi:hypothetical protein